MSTEKIITDDYFLEALLYVMKAKGLNQAQLSEITKIPAGRINEYVHGKRAPKRDVQVRIARALDYDLLDFLNLATPKRPEPRLLETDELTSRGFLGVPYSKNMKLAAGGGGTIPITDDEDSTPVVVYGPALGRRNAKNLQAYKVGGDSMDPIIAEGGIVVADQAEYHRDPQHIHEGGIYVLCWDRSDGECAVKYLRWAKKDQILSIESENSKAFPPVFKDIEDVVLIGRVIWAWREF
jgi:transcriptional regulator with XRE-family HTH domain